MIATQGRTVKVLGVDSNGISEQAAVITRAWSARDTREGAVMVNLTVFPDSAMPMLLSSVQLFDTREQASAYRGGNPYAKAAFWPEREPHEPEAAAAAAPAQLAA